MIGTTEIDLHRRLHKQIMKIAEQNVKKLEERDAIVPHQLATQTAELLLLARRLHQ